MNFGLRDRLDQVIRCHYDRFMKPVEEKVLASRRRVLPEPLQGTGLEVGAGTGENRIHYGDLARPFLSDPDSHMIREMRSKAGADGCCPILQCAGEQLPCGDGRLSWIVSTLTLCSVRNSRQVLSEFRRVLRPGGRLIFLEHVRDQGRRGRWQDRIQPVWTFFSGGCHPNRDTVGLFEETGFVIEELEYFDPSTQFTGLPFLAFQLFLPFVAGSAKRP